MVVAIILFLILCVSLLMNLGNLLGTHSYSGTRVSRTVGPKLEEVLTEDNDAGNKVAIITVTASSAAAARPTRDSSRWLTSSRPNSNAPKRTTKFGLSF